MLRRCISVLAVFCLLLTLTACGGDLPAADKGDTAAPPASDTPALSPTFEAMPQKVRDLAEVYRLSDTVALFAFITPGMDASLTELVCYDLAADQLLGELDLGECWVSLFPLEEGFALFDYDRKTYATYDAACQRTSAVALTFDGAVGTAAANGRRLLLSDMRTGRYYVYDLTTHVATPVDETVGAADFICVGNHKDSFLLHSYTAGVIAVTPEGKREPLNTVAAAAQAVSGVYAAGFLGDYAVFYSLAGGDAVMCPARGDTETFCDAVGNGYLSRSGDGAKALYYYDLNRRTVTAAPMDGTPVDAALYGSAALAVVQPAAGGALTYVYVDLAALTAEGMDAAAYDKAVIEDRRPLPAVSGAAAAVYDTYGVTVIGDVDVFDMAPYGYTVTAAAAENVARRTEQLQSFLAYFPAGVFRELSQKAPVVIVLCEDLGGSAGGLNTLIDGYNVSFLSVGGTDDYFAGIAAHELGHALERGIVLEDLDGWTAMQPAAVQAAYDDHALTVEYTADDKGNTPVWFTDAYGRFNAMEDRATVFEEMYAACVSGDASALDYDGLRKKVAYWSYMLRNNFVCCQGTVFPWDTLFG